MVRSDIDHDLVLTEHAAGVSINELAHRFKASKGTIRRILLAHGAITEYPPPKRKPLDAQRVASLYESGATMAAIAEQLDTTTWQVKTTLDRAGVARRTRLDYPAGGRRADIDAHAAEIARLYREEALDERALAARYKCGREVIRRILREQRVKPNHSPATHRKHGVRPCSVCGEEKPDEAFYPRRDRDSRMSSCIECLSVTQAARYAANAEYYRERSRAYYRADPERGRRIVQRWRDANADAVRAMWRSWYLANAEERRAYAAEHKERLAEIRREWASTERGRTSRRAAGVRRRARLIEATTDEDVDTELLLALRAATSHCELCSRELDYDTQGAVHLDHIVPLAAHGLHIPDNLRYICSSCNLARPKDGRDVPEDHPARAAHRAYRT